MDSRDTLLVTQCLQQLSEEVHGIRGLFQSKDLQGGYDILSWCTGPFLTNADKSEHEHDDLQLQKNYP